MCHVVGGSQRIAQGVDCGTSGIAKCDAGVVAGQQEILEQRNPCIRSLFSNFLITGQYHLDRLVAKHACRVSGLWRETGLYGVHQCIDGTGGKYAKWQTLQKLRDQNRAVGIHVIHGKSLFGAAAVQCQNCDVSHLAAGSAGRRNQNQLLVLFGGDDTVVQIQNR